MGFDGRQRQLRTTKSRLGFRNEVGDEYRASVGRAVAPCESSCDLHPPILFLPGLPDVFICSIPTSQSVAVCLAMSPQTPRAPCFSNNLMMFR